MRHNIARGFDHYRISKVQERQNPIEPQSHNYRLHLIAEKAGSR